MRIFNVILNGDDAKEFCNQSTDFKINWIRKYTNQKDMALIMDFINNPPKGDDCGCGCGDKKSGKESKTKEVKPEINFRRNKFKRE